MTEISAEMKSTAEISENLPLLFQCYYEQKYLYNVYDILVPIVIRLSW